MSTKRTRLGLAIAAAAVFALGSATMSRVSADEGGASVIPAVNQTRGASVQLVRHGWGGGHHHGWGRGYYGYGGGYRPYVRPYYGVGVGPRYGYYGGCSCW